MTKLLLLFSLIFFHQAAAKVRGEQDQRLLLGQLGDIPTHHQGGSTLRLRNLKGRRRKGRPGLKGSSDDSATSGEDDDGEDSCFVECDAEDVNLADYPQWQEEEGYWIGELTFYQADGTPFVSSNWNYRYDAYRGFITGNVAGNAYRQRNVFFYPPQSSEVCEATNPSVIGEGTCGVNGNTKIFEADQSATTCSTNPELGGDVNGPYQGIFETTTELIGADNALLYQVFLQGQLFQSQLTTLTEDENGTVRRTRSAQSFFSSIPASMSFYRERKVDETTFYAEMAATIEEYNILQSDLCAWQDNPSFNPPIIATGLDPGFDSCMLHLEESFEL